MREFNSLPYDQWLGLSVYGSCPRQKYSEVRPRKYISPIFDSKKCFPTEAGDDYWYAPNDVSYLDFASNAINKYACPIPIVPLYTVNRRVQFFKKFLAPFHQSINDEYLCPTAVDAFYKRPMKGADSTLFHRPKYGSKRLAGIFGGVQYAQNALDDKTPDGQPCMYHRDWLRGAFPVSILHKEEPLPKSKHTARGLGLRSTEEHILEVFFLSGLFERFKQSNASNSQFPWVFGCDILKNCKNLYDRLPEYVVCRDISRQDSSQIPPDFSARIDLIIHLLDLTSSRDRLIYKRYPLFHLKRLLSLLISFGCISMLSTKWGLIYLKRKGLISGDFFTLFFNCLHNLEKHVDYLIEVGCTYDEVVAFVILCILLGDDSITPPHADEERFHKYCYSIGVVVTSSKVMHKKDAEFIGHKFKFITEDFSGNELLYPYPVFVPIDYNKMFVNCQHIDPTDSVQIAYDHIMGARMAASGDPIVGSKLAALAHGLAKSYPFIKQQNFTADDLNFGHGLTAVPRLAVLSKVPGVDSQN